MMWIDIALDFIIITAYSRDRNCLFVMLIVMQNLIAYKNFFEMTILENITQ